MILRRITQYVMVRTQSDVMEYNNLTKKTKKYSHVGVFVKSSELFIHTGKQQIMRQFKFEQFFCEI